MVEKFDEIDWLTGFLLNTNQLKDEGLERVRNFVFLWNLFEDSAMQRDATIEKMKRLVDQINNISPLDAAELSEFVDYFAQRYFDPTGQSPYSLDGLKFRASANDQAAKADIEAVLRKNELNADMILKALLIITYRFRNNLFHGEKQLVAIDEQVSNFIVANSIIKLVLEKMKAVGLFKN